MNALEYAEQASEVFVLSDSFIRIKELIDDESSTIDDIADVIIIDKTIFLWHRKRLSEQFNIQQELVFHDIFDEATHFKVNFKEEAIRNDFNKALAQLRESGEYQVIVDQYLHTPASDAPTLNPY